MIALVYPGNELRNRYKADGISTIGDYGFELLDRVYSWDEINSNQIDDHTINHMEVLNLLKARMETWHRWVACSDQYEMLLREAMLSCICLAVLLKNNNIKFSIFHTSIAHHIDTIIVEVASIIAGVKQIFLYSNVINSRLMPIIQTKDVRDGAFLNATISNYNFKESIDSFIKNKRLNKSPLHNGTISNSGQNFIIAILYNFALSVKRSLFTPKKLKQKHLNLFVEYTFFDHLKMIDRQRKSIAFYKSNCILEEKISAYKASKVRVILIAAHFQPEATSFPEGWEFSNHINVVLELRRQGYKGRILYKEHPASRLYFEKVVGMTRVGMYRSKVYYEKLLSLGCEFLPFDYQLSLDDVWYLPVTITGTLALERALVGKDTIVCGYPWFKNCPNLINIKEFSNELLVKKDIPKHNICEKALEFLKNVTSFKTLINPIGIWTGIRLNLDKDEFFLKEYGKLLNYLNSEPMK